MESFEDFKQYIEDNYEYLFGRDHRIVVMYRTAEPHCYVARVPTMGITAYGDTPDEATEKLVRIFESLVHAYSKIPYKEKGQ